MSKFYTATVQPFFCLEEICFAFLTDAILKGIFYRSKDMTRIFKMLSGVGFGKVFRMKILNPIAALFLFPKNIK